MKALTIGFCLLGILAAGTSQAQKYNVTQMPLLPGGTYSSGSGINNAGQVAGTGDDSNGNGQAILWSNGVATQLIQSGFPGGYSGSVAINNAGVVIGFDYIGNEGVFAIGPNFGSGFVTDHHPTVSALNDSNVILGAIFGHTVIWYTGQLDFTPVTSVPNTPNNLFAATNLNGINASGVIVGEEYDTDADGNEYPIALRWTPAATSDPTTRWANSTIKVLVGLGGRESSAGSINSKGWIAGWATFKNGLQRAVLWEPTTAAYDLGTLGGKQSSGGAINSMGDIAGAAQTSFGAWHAVVWTHKHFVATDLNSEISAAWAKQITLTSAAGTNDRCMVLANGIDHKTGNSATFVLSLVNQSLCNNP